MAFTKGKRTDVLLLGRMVLLKKYPPFNISVDNSSVYNHKTEGSSRALGSRSGSPHAAGLLVCSLWWLVGIPDSHMLLAGLSHPGLLRFALCAVLTGLLVLLRNGLDSATPIYVKAAVAPSSRAHFTSAPDLSIPLLPPRGARSRDAHGSPRTHAMPRRSRTMDAAKTHYHASLQRELFDPIGAADERALPLEPREKVCPPPPPPPP